MRFILILLIVSINVRANDSLLIYNSPHQIIIEHNWQDVISKNLSLESQSILNKNLEAFLPLNSLNIPYKIVNDTSYTSYMTKEIDRLMVAYNNNYKIYKITPSDSLLKWCNFNKYPKIIFIQSKGYTKKFKKDAASYLIDIAIGGVGLYGFLLAAKKRPNLNIQVLIFDTQLQKFIYYQSAGEYGEPLKEKFAHKILISSLKDYFHKGPNIKIKR